VAPTPLDVVSRIQSALLTEDVVTALSDEEGGQEVRRAFVEVAAPDFEVAMIGPDYSPARQESRGPEGFTALWRDWTSPFEAYRIEVEEVIESGEKVVTLVRQVGTTKTGGVEIETPAAAVWTVTDGKLRRVEFHLDRDAALRAAGLDPHSSQA
jgi:ketosteroid isomerase-like protein